MKRLSQILSVDIGRVGNAEIIVEKGADTNILDWTVSCFCVRRI